MISAFFRLIVITFSSIAVIGAVLLAIRFYGLNHSYISVEHPLQNTPFFIVAEGGGSEVAPLFSQLAYDYAASLSNDIWLEADLRLSKDRRWVIVGEDFVDSLTSKKGRVSEFTLAELKDLNWGLHYKKNDGTFPYKNHKLDLLSVEEFLDRYPNRKIILDLHAKAPGAAEALAETLIKRKMGDRLIIFSRIPLNMEIIRSKAPLWFYGEPTTHLAKFNVLATLMIETVATIKGDVLFVPMLEGTQVRARRRLIAEFLRRKRKIILEGTSLSEAKKSWIFPHVFGFMTKRPTEALQEGLPSQKGLSH